MRDGTEGLLVTVADIIALPAFKNVELAAPCEGAERRELHFSYSQKGLLLNRQ